MKTVRRDWLLRKVKEGKVTAVESYHFDDMMGEERFKGELPVRLINSLDEFKEGFFHVREFDFKTKSGCAYKSENGMVHLRVHSNCSYDFRVKD